MRRERQHGGASIGAVIWILLFVGLVMVSKEMIPVKIRTSQLEDFMIELAKFSTSEPDEKLQKRILEKAEELQLPLVKDDVTVTKSSGRVRMRAPTRSRSSSRSTPTCGTSTTTSTDRSSSSELASAATRRRRTAARGRCLAAAPAASSAPTRSATRGVPLSRR